MYTSIGKDHGASGRKATSASSTVTSLKIERRTFSSPASDFLATAADFTPFAFQTCSTTPLFLNY